MKDEREECDEWDEWYGSGKMLGGKQVVFG